MNSLLPDSSASLLDRIKSSMVGLKMPRAIEVVDECVSRLDRGEITALEAVEQLLLEELTFREERRIRTALRMGRVNTVKTLSGYDFSFQPSLLIIDEIGYLPVIPGGGNLFFQLVNARYEKGAMILTSNRGFAEWGDIFGSPVVATALLDRLLHHAIVIQIDGSSYRLRRHADLLPEHIRSNALITPPAHVEPRRRGRPPKNGGAAQTT